MESRDGEERPLGELGKDKDHGLWPQSGPSEKIWKESLWRLSDRCWKNCYLLWWLLVLDPQKCSGIKGPLAYVLILTSDVLAACDRYFQLFLFFVLFSCYSHQSISDYSWEVYIVHSGVFAG